MMRRTPLAAFLLLAAAPLAAQANDPWAGLTRPNTLTASTTRPEITEGDLRSRLFLFSADSMEGRILGSRGNVKGTDYIAAELRRIGLEPAGENGSFFQ